MSETPLVGDFQFTSEITTNTILFIPDGATVQSYKESPVWGKFQHIVPVSEYESSVESLDAEDMIVVEPDIIHLNIKGKVYSLDGRLLFSGVGHTDKLSSGIYIVNVAGQTKKVFIP